MPTLLRVALGAIFFLVVMGAGVPALLLSPGDLGGTQLVWTLALTALTLPPFLVAVLVSAWDGIDAGDLRRMLLIDVAIQVVGVVALLTAAAGEPAWLLASGVLAVVGLLLNPALIALGRAARRIEARRPSRSPQVEAVDRMVARGRQQATIGGAIGLAIAVVGLGATGLLVEDGGPAPVPVLGAFGIAFTALGASLALLPAMLRFSRDTQARFGSRYSLAQRVGRIVAGKAAPADDAEQRAASEWAYAAYRFLPLQLLQTTLIIVAMLLVQLALTGADVEPRGFRIGVIVLLATGFVMVVPVTIVRMRRLAGYVAAHPVAAE